MMWLLSVLVGCPAVEPAPELAPTEQGDAGLPPTAKLQTHEAMVEDLEAVRHPSDGGGVWRRVSGPDSVVAGSTAAWELELTVGALGIAEGGAIVFQAPPFWGWDTPQVQAPGAPGFTRVTTSAEGVTLTPRTADAQLLWIGVTEGRLAEGDTVRIHYGAGDAGARVDRFAESGAALWLAVDGDGDGVRGLLPEPVRVQVQAGPARFLQLSLPSTAEPGDRVEATLAALDAVGNASTDWSGTVQLTATPGLGVPDAVEVTDGGRARVPVEVQAPGVSQVVAITDEGWMARSNPVVVREGIVPILWGDLQIHSGRSDGTGLPDEVWAYARDVAGLDVAAITDHDHWGMRFLDASPDLWEEAKASAARAARPGFVPIVGFEWTSWVYGHRHVLWFEPDPVVISSVQAPTDTPEGLWVALQGRRALTVAHHSAGGPVAVDWRHRPPEALEPVTEVASVHGQSLHPDSPGRIYNPVAGNFVIDQLRKGVKLGLMGSTDGHDGHPGLSQIAGPHGGLVGIVGAERTLDSVYDALRSRRVYATNGPRMVLRFSVRDTPMGGSVTADGPHEAVIRVVGTAPIERVDVMDREGERTLILGEGRSLLHHRFEWTPNGADDFVLVQVIQEDGGVAWSSPIWADASEFSAGAEN